MNIKAILTLLPKEEQKKGKRILLLIAVRSLLDFISIAGVVSALFLLISHGYATSIWIILFLCTLVIAIKSVASYYIDNYCMDWYLSLYRYYSSSVFSRYYQSGLLFIREKGYTNLTYEVNSICYTFAVGVISTIFQSIGKLILIIIMFVLFMVYSPLIASIFLLTTLFFSYLYIFFIRNKISDIGRNEDTAKKEQWRNVQECFKGYLEIETNQALPLFNKRFQREMNIISSCQKRIREIQQLPSGLIEICMFLVLAVIIFIANNNQEIALLFGIVSIGSMRLLPSIQYVISGWSQIQNYSYTADIISTALNIPIVGKQETPSNLLFNSSIFIDNISFSYDKKTSIINDICFSISKGESVGIQGLSGIGKSTLLNILLGFIKPDKGGIFIDSTPLSDINLQKWHLLVGYVPQEVFIMNGNIVANITFGHSNENLNSDLLERVLRATQLNDWVDSLPNGIHTIIGESGCLISSGQKQRIGIARALYKGAKILFLDEATSALDDETEKKVLDIIYHLPYNGYEVTLVMVSHKGLALSRCNKIVKI